MSKMDFSDRLKKAESATKKATKKVAVSAVQVGAEKVQVGAKILKDATKKKVEKISESMKQATDRKQVEKKALEEKIVIEECGGIVISAQNAMQIFYYMISIDKKITSEEEEIFDLIGNQIDSDFETHKEAIVKACKKQIEKMSDIGDYYDIIRECVEIALTKEQKLNEGYITPKLLIWDLLTIAYSDGQYCKEECRLIKYIARKLKVQNDIFLEMENSIVTINDIEKEMNWLKGTKRPYLVIEKHVKELEKRRNDILQAGKAMIMS